MDRAWHYAGAVNVGHFVWFSAYELEVTAKKPAITVSLTQATVAILGE